LTGSQKVHLGFALQVLDAANHPNTIFFCAPDPALAKELLTNPSSRRLILDFINSKNCGAREKCLKLNIPTEAVGSFFETLNRFDFCNFQYQGKAARMNYPLGRNKPQILFVTII
jgi:hypothetical protein